MHEQLQLQCCGYEKHRDPRAAPPTMKPPPAAQQETLGGACCSLLMGLYATHMLPKNSGGQLRSRKVAICDSGQLRLPIIGASLLHAVTIDR